MIKNGELDKYILFSNNEVESFNHLMNQCIELNSKVSIAKFIDIIKFVFIRMTSNNDKDKEYNIYEEKSLISDLLRELVQ